MISNKGRVPLQSNTIFIEAMRLELLTVDESQKVTSMLKQRKEITSQIEALQQTLKEIDKSFAVFERNTLKRYGSNETSKGAPSSRRNLKNEIIQMLQKAKGDGLSVAEIASGIEVPNANVHSWFSSTGKKIKEITSKGNKGGKRYYWEK